MQLWTYLYIPRLYATTLLTSTLPVRPPAEIIPYDEADETRHDLRNLLNDLNSSLTLKVCGNYRYYNDADEERIPTNDY